MKSATLKSLKSFRMTKSTPDLVELDEDQDLHNSKIYVNLQLKLLLDNQKAIQKQKMLKKTDATLMQIKQAFLELRYYFQLYSSYGQSIFLNLLDKQQYQTVKENEIIFNQGTEKKEIINELFFQGDKGDQFYIILYGSVGIYKLLPSIVKGDPPEIKKMNELKEGESFGEIALLKGKLGLRNQRLLQSQQKRKVYSPAFLKIFLLQYYVIKQQHQQIIETVEIQKLSENTQFLQTISIFKFLAYDAIRQIYFFAKKITYRYNQVVFKKNDPTQDVFIIKTGEFRVYVDMQETLNRNKVINNANIVNSQQVKYQIVYRHNSEIAEQSSFGQSQFPNYQSKQDYEYQIQTELKSQIEEKIKNKQVEQYKIKRFQIYSDFFFQNLKRQIGRQKIKSLSSKYVLNKFEKCQENILKYLVN